MKCETPRTKARLIAYLFAFLITMVTAVSGRANEANFETVVVPFWSVPPFMQWNDEGERAGFFIAMAEVIAKETGMNVEYLDLLTAEEFLQATTSGRSEMVAGIVRLEPMSETHVYSEPVATDRLRFAVLLENVRSFETVEPTGLRVGIVPPTLGSEEPVLARNTPVPYQNVEAALIALLAGNVDALLIPPATVFKTAREAGLDHRIVFAGNAIRDTPRFVALHESRADLMPAINQAISRLRKNGRLEELLQSYAIKVPAPPPRTLKVSITHSPPYGIVTEDGAISGYATEVFRDIAELAGLEMEFVPVPLEDYFSSAGPGKNDVIPLVLLSRDLRAQFDVTIPVDIAELTILVRPDDTRFESLQDLSVARVGAFPDTIDNARENGFGAASLKAYGSIEELVTALEDREIDAIMETSSTLRNEGLTETLKSVGSPTFRVENVIGLRRGLGAARERLNSVIPAYLLSEDYTDVASGIFREACVLDDWTDLHHLRRSNLLPSGNGGARRLGPAEQAATGL